MALTVSERRTRDVLHHFPSLFQKSGASVPHFQQFARQSSVRAFCHLGGEVKADCNAHGQPVAQTCSLPSESRSFFSDFEQSIALSVCFVAWRQAGQDTKEAARLWFSWESCLKDSFSGVDRQPRGKRCSRTASDSEFRFS